jgi:hypothetical protein
MYRMHGEPPTSGHTKIANAEPALDDGGEDYARGPKADGGTVQPPVGGERKKANNTGI